MAEERYAEPGDHLEAPVPAELAFCKQDGCHRRIYRQRGGTWFHLETQRMTCAPTRS